ncbi:MAG: sulfotransferase [Anaerolineae bacterium]
MSFDFKGIARFTYKSLFRSKGTPYRLTSKRIAVLVLSYPLYSLLELVTWIGFALDEIFFGEYRKLEIKQPVYIIGNPRSGTTFLQRLLARDERTFNSMRTWETVLAPSITLRKAVGAVSALDRRLGNRLHKWLGMLEESWQAENVVHRIAIRAPEEDEYLLIHIFSSLKIWLYAAMLDETEPYTYFDTRMPDEEKDRIMTFYRRCVQRHLYTHGDSGQRYLAKDPHFSPMVDTLFRYLPSAKFIYLVRNPLDMIPSYISLKEDEWQLLGNPAERYASRQYVLDMADHWYSYPLERLAQAPHDSFIVVSFNDLVSDARQTVTEIYDRFGMELSPEFDEILRETTEKARQYESEHEYSLQEMGLTREQIVTRYQPVFERFDFDTRDGR